MGERRGVGSTKRLKGGGGIKLPRAMLHVKNDKNRAERSKKHKLLAVLRIFNTSLSMNIYDMFD